MSILTFLSDVAISNNINCYVVRQTWIKR